MHLRASWLYSALLFLSVHGYAAEPVRTNPKPLVTPSPRYPAILADSGKSGTATIEFVVKADGSVADPRVKSADDPAFAEAALAAVSGWTFEPGLRDGVATELLVAIPFNFSPPIEQQLNAKFKRKVFVPIPETPLPQKVFGKLPKAVSKIQPVYPKTLMKARVEEDVQVQFIIAPDGSTLNPTVLGTPRKELVMPAVIAVAMASYQPPRKDGKPVYVDVTTKVHFEPPQRRVPGGGGGGGDVGGGGGGGGGPDSP